MASVEISPGLHEQIEDRVDDSDFDTVEEYVSFVLETVTEKHLAIDSSTADSAADQEGARENLKSLGYLE